MTTKQAIQLLHRLQDEQFDGEYGDERREALKMAVRALEGDGDTISRKAVMKEFSDFVRKSNNSDFAPTPTWNDAVSLVGSMPSAQIATDINVGDTISRKAAIDEAAKWLCDVFGIKTSYGTATIFKRLRDLPSAQPQRRTGRWIRKTDTRFGEMLNDILICSECGIAFPTLNMIRRSYCPSCGADMRGEEHD